MKKYIVRKNQLYLENIYNPVHRVNIIVAWSESHERLEELCSELNDEDIIPTIAGSAAFIYKIHIKGIFTPVICLPFEWKRTSDQISSISHEAIHAICSFFRFRRIPLPKDIGHMEDDEENFCYYTDWLIAKIIDCLDNQEKYKYNLENEKEYEVVNTIKKTTRKKSGSTSNSRNMQRNVAVLARKK